MEGLVCPAQLRALASRKWHCRWYLGGCLESIANTASWDWKAEAAVSAPGWGLGPWPKQAFGEVGRSAQMLIFNLCAEGLGKRDENPGIRLTSSPTLYFRTDLDGSYFMVLSEITLLS
jgi:hypothetical protein